MGVFIFFIYITHSYNPYIISLFPKHQLNNISSLLLPFPSLMNHGLTPSKESGRLLVLFLHFKVLAAIALLAIFMYLSFSYKRAYLVDFLCHKAPDTHRVPISTFIEHKEVIGKFNSETLEFQNKVIERSGLGNESYFPSGIHLIPTDHSFKSTAEEVEMVVFTIVQALFTKHTIDPGSINILVTNCSISCPTPSLASMIINKFGFRSNVRSFNLSGMGCSSGLLSISLAKDLFQVHKNSLALVVSTESICSNMYHGKDKSMLLANCLFRMGKLQFCSRIENATRKLLNMSLNILLELI